MKILILAISQGIPHILNHVCDPIEDFDNSHFTNGIFVGC
jgi:hypothetical protein